MSSGEHSTRTVFADEAGVGEEMIELDAPLDTLKIMVSALPPPPCPRCFSTKVAMCDGHSSFTDLPRGSYEAVEALPVTGGNASWEHQPPSHRPHPVCLECGYTGETA